MKKLLASLENIAFEGNPKLGSELNDIFTKAFEYRDSIDENREFKDKVRIMHAYMLTDMQPALEKLVQKHLNIKKLTLEVDDYGYPVYSFYTMPAIINGNEWIRLIMEEEYNGVGRRSRILKVIAELQKKNNGELIELFRHVSANMDQDSGYINETKTMVKNKVEITITLGLCLHTSFFLHDHYPDPRIRNMNPEELTGIVLHEFGHSICALLRSTDTYMTIKRNTDLLEAILRDDRLTLTDYAEIAKITIENNKKEGSHSDLTKSLERLVGYVGEIEEGKEVPVTIFRFIKGTILFLIFSISLVKGMMSVLNNVFDVNDYVSMRRYRDNGEKRGDLLTTKNNFHLVEKDADAFAVRCGYGAHMTTGLSLIYQAAYFSNHAFWMGYDAYSMYLMRILININPGVDTIYEEMVNRVKSSLRENSIFFKKMNVPKNLLLKYMEQQENLERYVQAFEENKAKFKWVRFFKEKIILQLPEGLASLLGSTRLVSEYEKIQNQVEDLINNPLYYQQAKLKSLIK